MYGLCPPSGRSIGNTLVIPSPDTGGHTAYPAKNVRTVPDADVPSLEGATLCNDEVELNLFIDTAIHRWGGISFDRLRLTASSPTNNHALPREAQRCPNERAWLRRTRTM